MDVFEKDDEIILRDIPFANWLHGVSFLLASILFGVPVVIAINKIPAQFPEFYLLIPFAFSVSALYWAGQKLRSPVIITRVKLNEKTVHIKRLKFPFKTQTEIYNFARIRRFETVKRKPDRAYLYFNVMILKDGACIDLESDGMEIQTNRIPAKLNELLQKHRKPMRKR